MSEHHTPRRRASDATWFGRHRVLIVWFATVLVGFGLLVREEQLQRRVHGQAVALVAAQRAQTLALAREAHRLAVDSCERGNDVRQALRTLLHVSFSGIPKDTPPARRAQFAARLAALLAVVPNVNCEKTIKRPHLPG